jgi:predicted amidohydrolase YtcJ
MKKLTFAALLAISAAAQDVAITGGTVVAPGPARRLCTNVVVHEGRIATISSDRPPAGV